MIGNLSDRIHQIEEREKELKSSPYNSASLIRELYELKRTVYTLPENEFQKRLDKTKPDIFCFKR